MKFLDFSCLQSILSHSLTFLGILEPSWGVFGRFGGVLEAFWKRLGAVLGRFGAVLGLSCALSKPFSGRLGAVLGALGYEKHSKIL